MNYGIEKDAILHSKHNLKWPYLNSFYLLNPDAIGKTGDMKTRCHEASGRLLGIQFNDQLLPDVLRYILPYRECDERS